MTANVMVPQHSNGHDVAMHTTHKQQTSGSEAIWFSRFLSRKSRKNSSQGPIVSVTDVHLESPSISPTAEGAFELAPGRQHEQASKTLMVAKTNERPLTSKKSVQTLKSKSSFSFMSHRKPSTTALSTKAATITESESATQQPRKKSAAYVPKHAGSDFSQVAVPTTYRDSYASLYSSGSDRRPSSSATTPPQEFEPRRHASVGNMQSSSVSSDDSAYSRHVSVDRVIKAKRSVVFLADTDQQLSAKKSSGRKGSIAPGGDVASTLFEKYISDGLQAPPKHHQSPQQKQPKTALRTQSTPDIRSAAAKTSTSTTSSSKVYAKYREHQQQHAPHNIIFTVPEYDREASRPGTSATTATATTTATNGLGLHPPPQSRKSSSVAPHSGQTSPRKLSRRESSASISTHRSGRAGSTAGSIHGEQSTGISSFGRKLSEYIKPAAISETNTAAAQYSSRRPSAFRVADE